MGKERIRQREPVLFYAAKIITEETGLFFDGQPSKDN